MTQNGSNAPGPVRNQDSPGRWRAIWNNSLLIIGSLVALFAVGCAADGIVRVFGGTRDLAGSVAALIFFVGLAVGVALLAKSQLGERRVLRDLNQEQHILSYAKAESGRGLTIAEVALHCSLSISDTSAVLNRLVKRSVCEMDISPEGELIYVFSGFKKQIES